MTITATHHGRWAFQRRRHGWIGIDIGASTLKLAQVERRAGQWQLGFGQILPITAAAAASPEALRQTLTASLRTIRGWRPRPAACLLPWSTTDLRTAELPPAGDDELAQLVATETAAEQETGGETLQVAHWRAGHRPVGDQLEPVHILSVPTATASAAIAALMTAKLDCHVVDARPFALARAVAMSRDIEPDQTVAAVDWGFDQLTVVLVRNGRPCFTRLLPENGLRFVLDKIQRGLKLSADEARALLCQFTLQASAKSNSDVTNALHGLTQEPIDRTAGELKRTLAFATQETSELEARKVLLFGGGATVPGFDQLLTEYLGIPAQAWSLGPDSAAGANPLLGEAIALSAIPLWP